KIKRRSQNEGKYEKAPANADLHAGPDGRSDVHQGRSPDAEYGHELGNPLTDAVPATGRRQRPRSSNGLLQLHAAPAADGLYRTVASNRGNPRHAARLHATAAAVDGCLPCSVGRKF